MTFTSKRVAVTGAAGNLGQAVAAAFHAAGASLVLLDRVEARLDTSRSRGKGEVSTHVVDLTDADAVIAEFAKIGAVDSLANIAGGFDMGTPVHEVSVKAWEFMLDINARTMLNTVRAAIPYMLEQGHGTVVSVSAKAALVGGATMGPYAASKSIVIRATESMAAELKGKGINVNCVLPSAIDTPQNRAAMPNADTSKWVQPEALAEVILFLSSPAARAIHGAAIPVTGLS